MFSLTIVFGPGPMVWTLMFKTEERALQAQSGLNCVLHEQANEIFGIEDDFGQHAIWTLTTLKTASWMLENLEQSRLAHIERALHQARTQAKGAEIADNDPVLKQARHRAQGGMPMIQPVPGFGPNGRFPS